LHSETHFSSFPERQVSGKLAKIKPGRRCWGRSPNGFLYYIRLVPMLQSNHEDFLHGVS